MLKGNAKKVVLRKSQREQTDERLSRQQTRNGRKDR